MKAQLPSRGRLVTMVGSDMMSDEQKWKLLDEAYRVSPIAVAALAISLVCLIGAMDEYQLWQPIWAGTAIPLLIGRFLLSRAYRRRKSSDRPETWARRFTFGAAAAGFQWGLGWLGVAAASDPHVVGAIFGVSFALISASTARTYYLQIAALTQGAFVTLMIALPALVEFGPLGLVIFVLYVAFQLQAARLLGDVKLQQIVADRDKNAMLAMLTSANTDLAEANAKLEGIALTDALTGVANRRRFDDELAGAARGMDGTSAPISLILLDIDHFKRFNDTYGHQAGDACLAVVADRIMAATHRTSDLVARYGGEEFAVILRGTDRQGAEATAERIRRAIEDADVSHATGARTTVTASLGIATGRSGPELNPLNLVHAADTALYRAKKDGRNCLRTAGDIEFDQATAA